MYIFFFKQKTAYEMRIRDWSSDVCSSDLTRCGCARRRSIRRGSSRRSSGPTRPKPTGLMTMGTNCDLLEQMALYEKHLSRVADHTGRQLGASLLRDAPARIIMLERLVDRYDDTARMTWCDIPEMQSTEKRRVGKKCAS